MWEELEGEKGEMMQLYFNQNKSEKVVMVCSLILHISERVCCACGPYQACFPSATEEPRSFSAS